MLTLSEHMCSSVIDLRVVRSLVLRIMFCRSFLFSFFRLIIVLSVLLVTDSESPMVSSKLSYGNLRQIIMAQMHV